VKQCKPARLKFNFAAGFFSFSKLKSNYMNLADVNAPSKFTEETETFSGDKTISQRNISALTKKRQRAEKTILAISKNENVPVDEVVKRILVASASSLRRYVQSKGETPQTSGLALSVQAALLRAEEVATIAKAIGTTDADALNQIESAEQDAIDTNNADVKNILAPDVQAALKLTLDHIKNVHVLYKGSGKLSDFVQQVKRRNKNDGFDLNTSTLLGSPTGGKIGSKSPGGSFSPNDYGLMPYDESRPANGFDIGNLSQSDITSHLADMNPANQTSSGGGFFNIFNQIVAGVNSVSNSIKTASGSINDVINNTGSTLNSLLGGVKDTASDVGADSIRKAMVSYIPYIIAGVVAITLIIVISIYASKNK
jgi:hypothetical protein